MGAQQFDTGSVKTTDDLKNQAAYTNELSKQGAAQLKEFKSDATKLSDQFRKRASRWGQELSSASKSKESGAYEKTMSRHEDEQMQFIASLSDMMKDLPPPEQDKAKKYLTSLKASGALSSEAQAIFDYELLESGGSTPDGYSKMAKFKRPAKSASEYTALGNDARRNQTDANTKYLLATIAERNGQTEQAKALREEGDILQKNAVKLARRSNGRASLANDKVVLGDTLTKEQKAIQENLDIRDSNPKLYAENAVKALVPPEQINQKLEQLNNMSPEDAKAVGDELYKLTGGHRSTQSYLNEEGYSAYANLQTVDAKDIQKVMADVLKDPNISEGARIAIVREFRTQSNQIDYRTLTADTIRKNLISIKNKIVTGQ